MVNALAYRLLTINPDYATTNDMEATTQSTPGYECWDGIRTFDWAYNDGGRALAGFRGQTGDCITRAIAIGTGYPYVEIYNELNRRIAKLRNPGRHSARTGVPWRICRPYLIELGWTWHPRVWIGIKDSERTRFCPSDLPDGKVLVQIRRHLTCVIDGVIYDTHDCQMVGQKYVDGVTSLFRLTVYGYFTPPGTTQ